MIQVFIKNLENKTKICNLDEELNLNQLKQKLINDKIVNTDNYFILKNGTLLADNPYTNLLEIENK